MDSSASVFRICVNVHSFISRAILARGFVLGDASDHSLMGTWLWKSLYQRQGDFAFVRVLAEAFQLDVLLLLDNCMCIYIDVVVGLTYFVCSEILIIILNLEVSTEKSYESMGLMF